MLEIENKRYGPDSSAQEIAAIAARIYALDDDIFVWHELPMPSVFSVVTMAQSLREKTQHLDGFYLIADLSEPERPNAEVREAIRDNMLTVPGTLHLSAMVGGNVLLHIAAKFVISRLGLASWSVTKSMEDSRAEIATVKAERSRKHG